MITEDYCSKEVTDLLKEKGFKCGATYSKGFVKDGDGFVGGLVRHEDKITYLGGDNFESKCRYCGRPILWSSGGWFSCRPKKGGEK